jgi:hypothetical protein
MSGIRARRLAARDFRRILLGTTIARVGVEAQTLTGRITALRLEVVDDEPLLIVPVLVGEHPAALPTAIDLSDGDVPISPRAFADTLHGVAPGGVTVLGDPATLAARQLVLGLPDGKRLAARATAGTGRQAGLWFFEVLAEDASRSSVAPAEVVAATTAELVSGAADNPASAPNTIDRYAARTGALLDNDETPIEAEDHDGPKISRDPKTLALAREYHERGDSVVALGVLQFPGYMLAIQNVVDLTNEGRTDEAEALMHEWNLGFEDDPSLVAEFGYQWVIWDRDTFEWVASDEGLI